MLSGKYSVTLEMYIHFSNEFLYEHWIKAIIDMSLDNGINLHHFSLALRQTHLFHLCEFWQGSGLRLLTLRLASLLLVLVAECGALVGQYTHCLIHQHASLVHEIAQHDVFRLTFV